MFKQALRTGRPPSLTLTLYTNIPRSRYLEVAPAERRAYLDSQDLEPAPTSKLK